MTIIRKIKASKKERSTRQIHRLIIVALGEQFRKGLLSKESFKKIKIEVGPKDLPGSSFLRNE